MYASDRCEPMNPAPPVISTFTVVLQLPSRSGRGRTADYSDVTRKRQPSLRGRGTDTLPKLPLELVDERGAKPDGRGQIGNRGIHVSTLDPRQSPLEVDLRTVVD